MPSGITHILLTKNLQNILPAESDLKMVLAAGRDFLQVGALGPDLPYASVADSDFIFSSQSDLADKFHYEKTNEIPLKAFPIIRSMRNTLSPASLRNYFSFFLGYLSHVVADGIIHPFVRDKVGDYKDNQTEHRILEMNLDVILLHHLTKASGHPIEFNQSNIHDELLNFDAKINPDVVSVITLFSRLIHEVYGKTYETETILDWIKGLHRMFGIAEGEHIFLFESIPILRDYLFKDYDQIKGESDQILLLGSPKDRTDNFLKKPQVHFIDDVLPRFYSTFIPLAQKAYDFIYNDGPAFSETEFAAIDLDTGRLLASNNNLDLIPSFWS
ncbi:MAG: zinc dependent phospholipase C family protein [archaeon]